MLLRLISIIVLLVFFKIYAWCQPCFVGNYLRLSDQEDIDNFVNDYESCSVIYGNIIIWEDITGSIRSLSGLSHITSIHGDLTIRINESLEHLNALTGLDSVYGSLTIEHNDHLTSIEGISGIRYIGEDLKLSGSIITTTGIFNAIDTIGRLIIYLPLIENLEAFQNLEYAQSLILDLNGAHDLSGLSSLEYAGYLRISGGDSLVSLGGLEKLSSVRELTISHNAALVNLNGLEEVVTISEELIIENNRNLTSLEGLEITILDSINNITVELNQGLSICNTIFICGALEKPGINIRFENNAPGCNSFFEVVKDCQLACPANFYFQSQEDIDSFPSLFQDCRIVMGDISISPSQGEIRSLDSLYIINNVHGNLNIFDTKKLNNLNGLHNLTSIGSTLAIQSNDSLISLSGLDGLISVGDVFIINNKFVENLNGLNKLEQARDIRLWDVKKIFGLENLNTVDGDFEVLGNVLSFECPPLLDTIGGSLIIKWADSLQSITGFEHLKSVGGLEINRTGITSFTSFSGLEQIKGPVLITRNHRLHSSGLENLSLINGGIEISRHDSLKDLSALQNLDSIYSYLILSVNRKIENLQDLRKLKFIGGDFIIQYHDLIKDFSGLEDLSYIRGKLQVYGMDSLRSLTGLQSLEKIGGNLSLYFNRDLVSLEGAQNMDSILGAFYMYTCSIQSFEGLNKLVYIGDTFQITYGYNLLSFAGLDSLNSTGDLFIKSCTKLENLEGLGNLQEIRGDLLIEDNSSLQSLTQWHNLKAIEGDLILSDNNDLSDISGLDSVRSLLGSLKIVSATQLTSLEGLGQLESIQGGLILQSTNIENLDYLYSLKEINGPMQINLNSGLTSLKGLANVKAETVYSVLGSEDVFIRGNNVLSDCAIDAVCKSMVDNEKIVVIENNNGGCDNEFQVAINCNDTTLCEGYHVKLETQGQIDSFPLLNSTCGFIKGDLVIEESETGLIINLDSLYFVHTVGGSLKIIHNYKLETLNGLQSITRVGRGLEIWDNKILNNIEALENLDVRFLGQTGHGQQDIAIINNDSLNECAITPVCELFTIPGSEFNIYYNSPACADPPTVKSHCVYPSICELDVVKSQQTINEFPVRYPSCIILKSNLIISSDDLVTDLGPLSQLQSIDGKIDINNNNLLSSLDGLENIIEIDGKLRLYGNDLLSDISALANIDPVSIHGLNGDDDIEIRTNRQLSNCSVESICGVLTSTGASTYILDNVAGCNSDDEIIDLCLVNIPDVHEGIAINVFPNPTSGQLTITTDIPFKQVDIIDATGHWIYSVDYASVIMLDHLPAGIYTILLHSAEYVPVAIRVLLIQN